jgi:hypothetical protein
VQHFPLTEKLHTDILEEKYGPVHSVVLKHDNKIREALLVDSVGVARTYALTFLAEPETNEVKVINKEIQNGKAIGKAFREHGYIVRKNVLDVFKIKIPTWLAVEFDTKEKYAKARLSEFYAKKENTSPIIYGTVTEVYTPDFRKAVVNATDKTQISAVTKELERVGFSKNEIWRRIGDENNYEDTQIKFMKAKKLSKKDVKILKKHIILEIKNRG